MLDIKFIRENIDFVKERLKSRNESFVELLEKLIELDLNRREQIKFLESLKNKSNEESKKIGILKKEKKDSDLENLFAELKKLSDEIKNKEKDLESIEVDFNNILSNLPNLPMTDLPIGKSELDNEVVEIVGEPRKFDFEIKDHVDIGEKLGILDFEVGAKIAGARFSFLKGLGAKLERAIFSFMLDTHTNNGYTEVFTPFLANPESLFGTGQLPKFEEDLFKCSDDLYLIPTAEVPITNIHRKEFVEEKNLPIKYVGYTPCFRREAGSYGKDTRGLIRNHQFNKVELVKLVKQEDGEKELQSLLKDACSILDLLEIPYRIVKLCTGDIGFSSAKTYDIEVWLPASNTYREISSCSLFTDFQARRLSIKYKSINEPKNTKFVYTLNGSGLAVGRTFAAILENYQESDGSVIIPKVLVKYMNGIERIK
jgi:seryl-tRNA synthetase